MPNYFISPSNNSNIYLHQLYCSFILKWYIFYNSKFNRIYFFFNPYYINNWNQKLCFLLYFVKYLIEYLIQVWFYLLQTIDVREIIYFIKKHLTFLQKITLFHCSRLMAYPSRSFFINLLFLVHSVIYIDGKSERYKYKVSPLNRFSRIS